MALKITQQILLDGLHDPSDGFFDKDVVDLLTIKIYAMTRIIPKNNMIHNKNNTN